MKILVDTGIWIAALDRNQPGRDYLISELRQLIRDNRLAMTGMIRQEILAGIPNADRRDAVRQALRSFSDEVPTTEDHETAAQYFTTCRGVKIKTSQTDCLLCAMANRRNLKIFTDDKHLYLLQKHLPIQLHNA